MTFIFGVQEWFEIFTEQVKDEKKYNYVIICHFFNLEHPEKNYRKMGKDAGSLVYRMHSFFLGQREIDSQR